MKIELYKLEDKIRYFKRAMDTPYYFFQDHNGRRKLVFENKYGDRYKFFGESMFEAALTAEEYARKQVKDGKAEEPKFIKKRKEKKEEDEK